VVYIKLSLLLINSRLIFHSLISSLTRRSFIAIGLRSGGTVRLRSCNKNKFGADRWATHRSPTGAAIPNPSLRRRRDQPDPENRHSIPARYRRILSLPPPANGRITPPRPRPAPACPRPTRRRRVRAEAVIEGWAERMGMPEGAPRRRAAPASLPPRASRCLSRWRPRCGGRWQRKEEVIGLWRLKVTISIVIHFSFLRTLVIWGYCLFVVIHCY
jgi:hypothetical protein